MRRFLTVDGILEILGVQRPVKTLRSTGMTPSALGVTRDAGTTDYAFYDRLRTCRAKGYEISGLLVKPLVSKVASWVIGEIPQFTVLDDERSTEALNAWWQAHHAEVLHAYEDAVALGDNYAVVNADLSLTAVPPHVIHPLVREDDFSIIDGWRIEETYPHPTDSARRMTIIDVYTDTMRTRSLSVNNATLRNDVWPVLTGMNPVVHIPNNQGPDEMFGHAEAEALTPALQRYNELLNAAMDGNKRQGRPTPVISSLGTPSEVAAFWSQNASTKTETLPDGTTQTYQELVWDADKLMTLGGQAEFSWQSPSSFMSDTTALLQLLFYLYVQHSELPEWVLGNAIASSRASAETQVEPLVKFIKKKRAAAEAWIQAINQRVLATLSLSDATVRTAQPVEIKWDSLTNEGGALKLQVLQWLLGESVIDEATALAQAPAIEIEDPAAVLERAHAEREQRQADFEARQERLIAQADANAQRNDGAQP